MRTADRAELELCGVAPLEALLVSLKAEGRAFTGRVNGRVICMFGVNPRTILSREAVIWLLTGDELPQHRIAFLRATRKFMEIARQEYDLLFNWTDSRYIEAHKWLRWLGFAFTGDRISRGAADLLYFEWRR